MHINIKKMCHKRTYMQLVHTPIQQSMGKSSDSPGASARSAQEERNNIIIINFSIPIPRSDDYSAKGAVSFPNLSPVSSLTTLL